MAGRMMLHCGGQEVKRADLEMIPLPGATDTYVPVPHYQLADSLATIGQDILTGWTLQREQYGLARDGNQMFGVLTFNRGNGEMGLSIGFRNSYDKSMSIGIAIGAQIFICDNLALRGEITVLCKHTQNVWANLEDTAIATLYKSQKNYEALLLDADTMKQRQLTEDDGYKMLGLLFGHGVISPRQLPVACEEWIKPAHEDFQPRNMWSLYNATTHALKSTAPISVMEKHIQAHELLTAV